MNAVRIPVLMYHRIGEPGDIIERKYTIKPHDFCSHMEMLDSNGYNACNTSEFVDWINGKIQLPENSLLITFDDGYLGVYEHGLPVLNNLKWPAAIFLVSGLIGKRDFWHHHEAQPSQPYPLLGVKEIDFMRSEGFSFYSHSLSHPDLTQLDSPRLEEELCRSRADLEQLFSEPVDYFAYPYGRYDDHVLDMVKSAGYKAAFSVHTGFNRPGIDPYLIRRIDVYGTDTPKQLLRKITLGTNDGTWIQTLRYYSRRLLKS